jgi:purine-binding chemotaxis protein CheW
MRWRADYINCLVKRGGEFIILPNLQALFPSRHETSTAG